MTTDNVVAHIDRTLTFYSTGLNTELTVDEAQARADIARVLDGLAVALGEWARGITAAFQGAGEVIANLATAMHAITEAAERQRRRRKVLHRWNEPGLRATMWDRKIARTGRTWTTRGVR